MSNSLRRFIAMAVFIVVLGVELAFVPSVLPDLSNKEVNDFMLISMGLAFFPLILVGVIAIAGFGFMLFVAYAVAAVFWPRNRLTIGELARRNANQAKP